MPGNTSPNVDRQQAFMNLAHLALTELEPIPFFNKAVALVGEALDAGSVRLFEFKGAGQDLQLLKAKYEARTGPAILSVLISIEGSHSPYGKLEVSRDQAMNLDEDKFLRDAASLIGASLLKWRRQTDLQHKILEFYTSQRDRDNFIAAMSHELRNPLNAILGFLTLIKDVDPGSPDFGHYMSAIERSAKIEAKLVSDLFDVARGLTGKLKMIPQVIVLQEVLGQCLEPLKIMAQQKNITIDFRADEQSIYIEGDTDRVHQVVWNLANNAIKFSPHGGRVSVELRRHNGQALIKVSDQGVGMEPQNLKKIFNPFWQCADKASRNSQGMGLGLFIVQKIVEQHQGSVEAFSEGEGFGSTFTVALPMASASIAPSKSERDPDAIQAGLGRLKVAVIDDSIDSLDLLKQILKKWGVQVDAFNSPHLGLRAVTSGKFDMLISDIGMPELDGRELIKQVRSWEAGANRTPITAIALTGFGSDKEVGSAREAGFDHHILKPLNFAQLQEKIIACAGRKISFERNLQ